MQSNPVFTLPWPPPLPPAAPAAGSVLCPPSLPQRERRGLAPPPLTHPCSLQPPSDRPPSAPCSTDQPMVGERDGPGCGWCCWALLAKSGWHCAACAPVTADKARRKSQDRQIDQKYEHIWQLEEKENPEFYFGSNLLFKASIWVFIKRLLSNSFRQFSSTEDKISLSIYISNTQALSW